MYKVKKVWSRERRGQGFHYIGSPRKELCDLSLGDLTEWQDRLRDANGSDEELLEQLELAWRPGPTKPGQNLQRPRASSHMERITDQMLAERNLRAPERLHHKGLRAF